MTWTIIGTEKTMQGREPVRDFLTRMHTQAFDAHPKVKTLNAPGLVEALLESGCRTTGKPCLGRGR